MTKNETRLKRLNDRLANEFHVGPELTVTAAEKRIKQIRADRLSGKFREPVQT